MPQVAGWSMHGVIDSLIRCRVKMLGDICAVFVFAFRLPWAYLKAFYRLFISPSKVSVCGKVIVITGSGSGLGRQIALRLAAEKARLVLWDISESGRPCPNSVTCISLGKYVYSDIHFIKVRLNLVLFTQLIMILDLILLIIVRNNLLMLIVMKTSWDWEWEFHDAWCRWPCWFVLALDLVLDMSWKLEWLMLHWPYLIFD